MALVSCPECGKQVSTGAMSCPHCGMVLTSGAPPPPANAAGVVFAPGAAPAAPEQTLWEGRPSLALVFGKILGFILRAIVLVAVGYLIIEFGLPALETMSADIRAMIEPKATMISWVIVVVLFIAMLPSATALLNTIAQIKNTHYKVTTQRILVERGVLSKSLQEIDMRSVDDTEFRQSLLERIFGIGEVSIVSTDKITPKVILNGIRDPRTTRELIRATAYQVSQRQLFTRST
jgi:membrane protein YdbS with pleckstrin-like domain